MSDEAQHWEIVAPIQVVRNEKVNMSEFNAKALFQRKCNEHKSVMMGQILKMIV